MPGLIDAHGAPLAASQPRGGGDIEDALYASGFYRGLSSLSQILGSGISNPEQWLIEALGGSASTAGVKINYTTALRIAYVWSAQQLISGDVAGLPLDSKRRDADGDMILDRSVPCWFLLNGDANPQMSSYLFRELMSHWSLLLGNGLAYILRDAMGKATQLIPACPGDLTPARVVDDRGEPVLSFTGDSRGPAVYWNQRMGVTFDAADILHIRGIGTDLGGHPLLDVAKNSFGLSLAVEKHGSEHFKRGGQPRIVLKHPHKLSEEDATLLLDTFEKRHSEAGRPALAGGGLEIEVLPVSNEQSQWNEARTRTIVEVAAWYGIPATKLGAENRGGYNSLLFDNQAYVLSLRKWLKRWETEVARKLLAPRAYRNGSIVIKHDPTELLETDTATKSTYIRELKDGMVITKNEARTAMGYPKVEGGDDFENSNTSTGGETPADDDAPPDRATAAAARASYAPVTERPPFVALIADRLEVLAGTMTDQAARRRKAGKEFDGWADDWRGRVSGYVGSAVQATAAVFTTMPVDQIADTVADWAATAENGGVLVPSPEDFAQQIVGETACTN